MTRWLHRLPLHLPAPVLRALARLVGVEWIAITTRGRRTGRPHTVMVDVVGRRGESWYVSPSTPRADWLRNARAHPTVGVRTTRGTTTARLRDATGAEGADVVLRFLRAHPWYGAAVVRMVGYVDRLDLPDDALRARLAAWPVFALEP